MDSEQTISNDALSPVTSSGSLSQITNSVEDEVIISAIKVNKFFGDKHVLTDVDFEVRKREVVALIGPSGSGKSTLIRCLNGLEKCTSGEIYIHGQRLDPHLSIKQLSLIRPELVGEVLKVMRDLAYEGSRMVVVTHEMQFARDVSDRVVFISDGVIMEQGDPNELFKQPKHERTRLFLERVLSTLP